MESLAPGVEGEGGATIEINGVENCSMYALDPTVDPVAVHYRVASGNGWRRTWDGVTDDYGAYPEDDTRDSPWGPVTIEDCPA